MKTSLRRTLGRLRNRDAIVAICEQWVPGAGVRRDLFGLFDCLAIADGQIVGIQSCTTKVSAHLAKFQSQGEVLKRWIRAGAKAQIWSWRRAKEHRGGKRKIWKLKIYTIALNDGKVEAIPIDDQ